MDDEIPLSGGNTSAGIVRVGDTVRRAPRPNAAAIAALLAHLDERAPGIAPRHLGRDARGREVLSWIDGRCVIEERLWREEAPLVGVARLLRRLHDACADFDASAWTWPTLRGTEEGAPDVLCHNDIAPYNVVARDGVPVALIDFDLAAPGLARRDVAYALYWYVPLGFAASDMRPFAEAELAAELPRTRRFCARYGIAADAALLAAVSERLHFLADASRLRALFDEAVATHLADEGHIAHWSAEARAFDDRRDALRAILERADGERTGRD